MDSRTLAQLDRALAWIERTKDRVQHWLRIHSSVRYENGAHEERLHLTFSITGKWRQPVRDLYVWRMRRDLRAMGCGALTGDEAIARQIEENGRAPDWLAELPSRPARQVPIDHEQVAAAHFRARP